MTIHQILAYFLHNIKGSILKSMAAQLSSADYRSLIAFFKKRWDPQKLLHTAAKQLFQLGQGYLILDEIVLEKHSIGNFWIIKRRWKSDGGYITPAISVVQLLWTDGNIRIPIRFELRRPGEGSVKDAAMNLLSWARNQARLKPQWVFFDAGFASLALLKRLNDYGWAFVCRIPKTRRFEKVQLWNYKKQGFWNEVGKLSNGLKVRAIRRAGLFYVTNRLSLEAKQVLELYRGRHVIEEVFKVLNMRDQIRHQM